MQMCSVNKEVLYIENTFSWLESWEGLRDHYNICTCNSDWLLHLIKSSSLHHIEFWYLEGVKIRHLLSGLMDSLVHFKINYSRATTWKFITRYFTRHYALAFSVLLVSPYLFLFYFVEQNKVFRVNCLQKKIYSFSSLPCRAHSAEPSSSSSRFCLSPQWLFLWYCVTFYCK